MYTHMHECENLSQRIICVGNCMHYPLIFTVFLLNSDCLKVTVLQLLHKMELQQKVIVSTVLIFKKYVLLNVISMVKVFKKPFFVALKIVFCSTLKYVSSN